jgi:hypothetical protein
MGINYGKAYTRFFATKDIKQSKKTLLRKKAFFMLRMRGCPECF